MSLAGLAIAIGDVADMGIIMTENIYRRIVGDERDREEVALRDASSRARREVGGAIVTAVSNTLVSFIPVFFLTGQEGKLFRPLAFTKTFAIGASASSSRSRSCRSFATTFSGRSNGAPQVWIIALAVGHRRSLATLATHFAFMWALAGAHDSGWPMAIVVGVSSPWRSCG